MGRVWGKWDGHSLLRTLWKEVLSLGVVQDGCRHSFPTPYPAAGASMPAVWGLGASLKQKEG